MSVRTVLGADDVVGLRGHASADDIAAVVSALNERQAALAARQEPNNYERWRQRRIAALYQRDA